MEKTYRDLVEHNYIEKKKKLLSELPEYCTLFLNAKADRLEQSTETNYAMDLLIFFTWVTQSVEKYIGYNPKDIPVEVFEELTPHDIDAYLNYLTEYKGADGVIRKNKNSAKSRKLSSLKALCKYLNRIGMTDNNPTELIETPKQQRKDIMVIKDADLQAIEKAIETGIGLNGTVLKGRQYTTTINNRIRNKAIISVLGGTGIRISELVGLNLEDIDMNDKTAYIVRKGGHDDHVYFSEKVKKALEEYLEYGRSIYHAPDDENALFLSMRGQRLSVRSVQYMITFFSEFALGKSGRRKITPHKYRSTFGTKAYISTHDLELTAALLGHRNVSTTSQSYVRFDESIKKDYIDSLDD